MYDIISSLYISHNFKDCKDAKLASGVIKIIKLCVDNNLPVFHISHPYNQELSLSVEQNMYIEVGVIPYENFSFGCVPFNSLIEIVDSKMEDMIQSGDINTDEYLKFINQFEMNSYNTFRMSYMESSEYSSVITSFNLQDGTAVWFDNEVPIIDSQPTELSKNKTICWAIPRSSSKPGCILKVEANSTNLNYDLLSIFLETALYEWIKLSLIKNGGLITC